MKIFEEIIDRVSHRNDHNQVVEDPPPDHTAETANFDCPSAIPFVDQRVWFEEPVEPISTEHEVSDESGILHYTSTIFQKLTREQFEILAQQIESIHSSEKSTDVAHFYALAPGVLDNMDPSSIVIMATAKTEDHTKIPIGYAYVSGTPTSNDKLRQIGVMVIPEYRKKGIAFQLFRDLLRHAAEFGITKLQIDFRTDNMPIWEFLKKASNPKHRLISFSKKIYGSEAVATIELLSSS